MTTAHQLHPAQSDPKPVTPLGDIRHADQVFGGRVRSLEEGQARRRADRETMKNRSGMRKFAAGLAIGAIVVVGAIEGLKQYVSGESQQARANHAALQADFVKPTEAELRDLGYGGARPPVDPENR